MESFLSKFNRLSLDVLSVFVCVIPPDLLFPQIDEKWALVCPKLEQLLDPKTSKHRWKIVNHHTIVHYETNWNNMKYTEWRLNGQLHREGDKPAVIYASGTKYWLWHGKCHREGDKPSMIYADGTKLWYIHGKYIK